VQRNDRRVVFLAAETAAGGGLDHSDPVCRSRQRVHHGGMYVVRALHGPFDHHDAVIRERQHALRFEVDVLLGAGPVGPLDDVRSIGQGLLYVAFDYGEVFEDVVVAELDLLRRWPNVKVQRRRLLADVDGDGCDCPSQCHARGVGQQHHRFVDVAHGAGGQYRLVSVDVLDLVGPGEVAMVDHDKLRPVDTVIEADFTDAAPR